MEPLYLSTEGMTDSEQMLLSMILSLASNQLTHNWTIRQGEHCHVCIYDISNSRARSAWEQNRTLPHPIPVVLSENPIPDLPWVLQKPIRTQRLIPFLNNLADWIGQYGASSLSASSLTHRPDDLLSALKKRLGGVTATRLFQAGALHDLKLIISGSASAGKSTAIRTISDIPPINTDLPASEAVSIPKPRTTVDLDYGELSLPDGKTLHLYGVPCHRRFDSMTRILCRDALGVVVLIDNRMENPMAELDYFATVFSKLITEPAMVVGVTHRDQALEPGLDRYEQRLHTFHKPWPVFPVDPRKKTDVIPALDALVTMLERARGPYAVAERP